MLNTKYNIVDITAKLLYEGILSKQDYERRQHNIDKRNVDNYQIIKSKIKDESLADDISNLLDRITKMRHEIHTSDDLFNTESANYKEQTDFIDNINTEIMELGLNPIKDLPDIIDITDDTLYYELHEYDTYEEAYEAFIQDKEKINSAIEKWLTEFDAIYGTNYAPTGAWRI